MKFKIILESIEQEFTIDEVEDALHELRLDFYFDVESIEEMEEWILNN